MLEQFDYGFFPDPRELVPDETGLVAIGGLLTPETVSEAYTKGIFPWSGLDPIPWFSPDPRLILKPTDFHQSRSLKKLARQKKLQIRFDCDLPTIIKACAKAKRTGQNDTWINGKIPKVYEELFERGIVHCVSAYDDHTMVAGLYGLTFGRVFFGESMFTLIPNASKIALATLCKFLAKRKFEIIDCQQETDHLKSLGATCISREEFLNKLQRGFQYPSLHDTWTGET